MESWHFPEEAPALSAEYVSGPGGVWLKPGLAAQLAAIDTLVFDMDGVLIHTEDSYPEVISRAVHIYFTRILRWPGSATLLPAAETVLFKLAGGFNSDWAVAQAGVLFYLAKAARLGPADLAALRQAPPSVADFTAAVRAAGGGLAGAERVALQGLPAALADGVKGDWDTALIERLCEELYGGEDWAPAMFGVTPRFVQGPGLFNRERPLIDPDRLARCGRKLGVYTGRVRREAWPALQLCRVDRFFSDPVLMVADGGYRKPDPGGLRHLLRHLGGRAGLFFGDNVDDCRTVLHYRQTAAPGEAPFWFAGVLGGVLGDRAEAIFRELGADLITPSVNAVLDLLPEPAAG